MDLIGRQVLLDAIRKLEKSAPTAQHLSAIFDCEDTVMAMQPVQPERKKGKWLPDNNNYYEERFICSVCGKSYKVDTCMGKPTWDFCPCGADMRGDNKNGY